MEVRVERSFLHFGVDVWLYDRTPDGGAWVWRQKLTPGGMFEWQRTPIRNGEIAEPSFRLPDGFAGPLAAALAEVEPPNTSMDRHLRDAVATRDRLLTLVEHVVKP
jgi:hypothetical protein